MLYPPSRIQSVPLNLSYQDRECESKSHWPTESPPKPHHPIKFKNYTNNQIRCSYRPKTSTKRQFLAKSRKLHRHANPQLPRHRMWIKNHIDKRIPSLQLRNTIRSSSRTIPKTNLVQLQDYDQHETSNPNQTKTQNANQNHIDTRNPDTSAPKHNPIKFKNHIKNKINFRYRTTTSTKRQAQALANPWRSR